MSRSSHANPFLVAAREALALGATYKEVSDDLAGFAITYPGCDLIEAAFDRGYRSSKPEQAQRVMGRLARLSL